jgi:hypothetical protein
VPATVKSDTQVTAITPDMSSFVPNPKEALPVDVVVIIPTREGHHANSLRTSADRFTFQG